MHCVYVLILFDVVVCFVCGLSFDGVCFVVRVYVCSVCLCVWCLRLLNVCVLVCHLLCDGVRCVFVCV